MEIIPWDLQWKGNVLFPVDEELHAQAVEFCNRELAEKFDARGYEKLWVARSEGQVFGVTGIKPCWDIPLFRSIDAGASFKMAKRINSYLADRGCRGQDVLLFLSQSEKPGQQCPDRDRILATVGARPAERFLVACK